MFRSDRHRCVSSLCVLRQPSVYLLIPAGNGGPGLSGSLWKAKYAKTSHQTPDNALVTPRAQYQSIPIAVNTKRTITDNTKQPVPPTYPAICPLDDISELTASCASMTSCSLFVPFSTPPLASLTSFDSSTINGKYEL